MKVAKTPLAEFPKKTIHNKGKDVIERRTAMLESYLRVAVIDPALLPLVLDFLSVPQSEVDAAARLSCDHCETKLSEGELLILTLQNRLSRDVENRMSALDHFHARFFQQHRHVKRDVVASLLAELVPLCGDAVCGCLALEIVHKAISCSLTRSSGEFKSALLHTPVHTLATMHLDEHILGRVQGDSTEPAFAVISVLNDHYELSGTGRNLLLVLNESCEALETFTNWQHGRLIASQQMPAREEWISTDCSECPYLQIDHRVAQGDLEVTVSLSSIRAPFNRVVEYIANPTLRKKWHPYIIDGRVIEEISPSMSVVEFDFDARDTIYTCLTMSITETFPNGDVKISYHKTDESRETGPFIISFLMEQSSVPVSLRKDSSTSNDSSDSSLLQYYGFPTTQARITQKAKYSGELKKMMIEDFANGRESLKNSWIVLKTFLETDGAIGVRKSHNEILLHTACSNKILSPRPHRHSLQPRY